MKSLYKSDTTVPMARCLGKKHTTGDMFFFVVVAARSEVLPRVLNDHTLNVGLKGMVGYYSYVAHVLAFSK